jgi:hypothetical protein
VVGVWFRCAQRLGNAAYFEEYEQKLGVAMEFLLLAVFFVISFVLFTLGGARLIM